MPGLGLMLHAGLLSNTDNGAPIIPVDEADRADLPLPEPSKHAPLGNVGTHAGAGSDPPPLAQVV
jgi:hypothetical protein